jgi:hypothetical protein
MYTKARFYLCKRKDGAYERSVLSSAFLWISITRCLVFIFTSYLVIVQTRANLEKKSWSYFKTLHRCNSCQSSGCCYSLDNFEQVVLQMMLWFMMWVEKLLKGCLLTFLRRVVMESEKGRNWERNDDHSLPEPLINTPSESIQ